MKTKLIRVNLWWGGPGITVASSRPVNATNPNDPAYDWGTYDRTVRYAQLYGDEGRVLRSRHARLGERGEGLEHGAARTRPTCATSRGPRHGATTGRSPARTGRRSRRCVSWLAWNEPNNPVFLKPQYVRTRRAPGRSSSAQDYAKMCNAIVSGLKAVNRANKVACGVTAPRGNNNPNSSRASVAPIAFLRAMKKAGAEGFDAYAHHPYYGKRDETPMTPPPPPPRGQPPTAVTLGNFQVLTAEVQRLYGNKRIWVTEYGYQTNPPDKLFGVTYKQQADYMALAYQKLKANPKVDMFIWFLLRDEARQRGLAVGGLHPPVGAQGRRARRSRTCAGSSTAVPGARGRRRRRGPYAPERGPALGIGRVDEVAVALDVAVLAADDEQHEVVVAAVRDLARRGRLHVTRGRPARAAAPRRRPRPGRCRGGRSRARPACRGSDGTRRSGAASRLR